MTCNRSITAATAAAATTLLVLPVLLAGCSGDSGDSGDSTTAPPAAQTIEGTAATGAALAGANVSVTDAAGNNVCVETTVVTSPTGTYKCTLQGGRTAPFLVVVVDPSGAHTPLVSLAFTTPAAGTPLVVNATPLTTAIVSQLSPGGDALNLAQAKTLDPATITAGALASTTSNVLAQLAQALTVFGAPAGYDPFTTPITAATSSISGNTADRVIELLKFSTINGVTTVATVDAPAAGVPLATATGTATPLPAPSTAVQSLAEAIRLLTPALDNCFKLASTARITARNTTLSASAGGPEATGVAADCQNITDPAYLHNGYRSGQAFYGLLNDAAMDGAVFSAPEIMQFIPAATAADRDRTVVNVRYVDKNGTAGNVITVAARFPGSATGAASDGRGRSTATSSRSIRAYRPSSAATSNSPRIRALRRSPTPLPVAMRAASSFSSTGTARTAPACAPCGSKARGCHPPAWC